MKMLFGVLLLSSLVCLTSAPAQAGLVGQSVTVDYLFFGVVAQQVAFLTVPPGGATFRVPPGNELQALTLFDNQITLSTDPGATVTYSANSLNFNGYEIVLPQNPPRSLEITAVDINPATTQAGFDSSRVTFGIDSVLLNMQGLTSLPGLNVALDLQFIEIPPPEVPEPGTMALLAGGMAVIAFAVRRRTRLSNGQSHGADGAA